MARRYRGPYARPSTVPVPYATAEVWGTGIDAIHSYYGEGPPIRVMGRTGHIGSSPVATDSPRDREYQNPSDSSGLDPPQEVTWGYPADDYNVSSFGMGANTSPSRVAPATLMDMDDRPPWDQEVSHTRNRMFSTMTPWSQSGERLRSMLGGARWRTPGTWGSIPGTSQQLPNETVSEGWLNKTTSYIADANPSDDAQIFVNTSMVQRYREKDNTRAQDRCTDDARTPIKSRVAAMVEKVYSGEERHYDMDPFQADEIERPFHYRTAGTGRADWMEANEWYYVDPVQRTPPPDPSMGVPEVPDPVDQWGYTNEDTAYYG